MCGALHRYGADHRPRLPARSKQVAATDRRRSCNFGTPELSGCDADGAPPTIHDARTARSTRALSWPWSSALLCGHPDFLVSKPTEGVEC